jgi:hypothetical protein
MSAPHEAISIPKPMVPHVYWDAYFLLAGAANEILPLVERIDCKLYPERFTEPLRRFDRAHRFLDALGWKLPAGDSRVSLEERPVLLDILSAATATQRDMLENARHDGVEAGKVHEMAAELAELTAYPTTVRSL